MSNHPFFDAPQFAPPPPMPRPSSWGAPAGMSVGEAPLAVRLGVLGSGIQVMNYAKEIGARADALTQRAHDAGIDDKTADQLETEANTVLSLPGGNILGPPMLARAAELRVLQAGWTPAQSKAAIEWARSWKVWRTAWDDLMGRLNAMSANAADWDTIESLAGRLQEYQMSLPGSGYSLADPTTPPAPGTTPQPDPSQPQVAPVYQPAPIVFQSGPFDPEPAAPVYTPPPPAPLYAPSGSVQYAPPAQAPKGMGMTGAAIGVTVGAGVLLLYAIARGLSGSAGG